MASQPNQGEPNESKEDAIIRVIGFRRQNHDKQIIQFDANFLSKWKTSMLLSGDTITGPVSGLGAMQDVPTEIINSILTELDIESCLNFRQVCRVARNIATNTLEYSRVATHAPTCLRAMFRTGLARSHSFADLYDALLLRHCEVCHKPAAYVYLPTLTKACDKCISVDRRFLTVTLASFAKEAGWTTARLRKRLTVVKTVPGDYRGWGIVRSRSVDMICFAEGLRVVNDATKVIRPRFGDQTAGMFIRRMVTAPLPIFDKESQGVWPILTCKGCTWEHMDLFHGLFTQQDYHELLWRYLPDHSGEGLLEHFEQCTRAKMIWAASNDGTASVRQSETDLVRNGAFKKELRMGRWTDIDRY
ncbi:hypothetical protein NKR19_g5146 [Coniochaeta hoffmannii]|uniref:F-box domain-containing protein n=1 Tax=Coniochaeta hoffmannii TaxID=91930 RepID=A0AA38RZH9_9PEZI|nr:hypothetical protein NKR19_g5146 [Coniochaeta hoffmannii]